MSSSTEVTSSQTSSAVAENPLKTLNRFGQSVWLDYIRRSLISTGELERLIDEDGLRGMTSNPSIFEKAITGSTDYAQALKELEKRTDLDATGIYEQLAIRDIQDAADTLRPVYDQHQAPRRLRQPRSFALPREQGPGNHRGSAPPLESGGPRERDDQNSRHARRHSRLSAGSSAKASTSTSRCSSRRTSTSALPRPTSPASKNLRRVAETSAASPAWPAFSSAASTRSSTL